MKSLKPLLIRIFNSSLKDKKGNIDMTDPSWTVRKVDQFDACGNMHGAVPCKTLVVFFRRITKQPVLIPTLQVSKKWGKTCDCLHASDIHMGSPNYPVDRSSIKTQCPFVLTQMRIGIFVRENCFCMYLAVKSRAAFLGQWHHHAQVGPHGTDVLSCAVISLSLKHWRHDFQAVLKFRSVLLIFNLDVLV